MENNRSRCALVAALALSACGGGGGGSTAATTPPTTTATFDLVEVRHAFSQLLPHRGLELNPSGQPTGNEVEFRALEELLEYSRTNNAILPNAPLPTAAVSPLGDPASHYVAARFSEPVDPLSVLREGSSGTTFGGPAYITGALELVAVQPTDQLIVPVASRVFVGGWTIGAGGSLERWVDRDPATGLVRALVSEASGFPGVANDFPGAADLVDPASVVFVADGDDDLTTIDTFFTGRLLRLEVRDSVAAVTGATLAATAAVTTSVDVDSTPPELVMGRLTGVTGPEVVPRDGALDVDPATDVTFRFTEPVQPHSVGSSSQPLTGAVQLISGPTGSSLPSSYKAVPVSPFDLTRYVLSTPQSFPGGAPPYSDVQWTLDEQTLTDLGSAAAPGGSGGSGAVPAQRNLIQRTGSFSVGAGPGVVNAPVMPEAIYVGRGRDRTGLSVIDLNGFGASTGNPVSSSPAPLEGESRYPLDPNFGQADLRPPMLPPTSTLDGGSAGVFTLTRDHGLDDLLTRAPRVADVSDIQAGHSLDLVFNNANLPFGCQSGSGDPCASTGLKNGSFTAGPAAGVVWDPNATPSTAGFPNPVSLAPHPNPPPLVSPALCVAPTISGREPTSVDSATLGLTNLLQPGDPFGDPGAGTPPSGLLGSVDRTPFVGPSFAQPLQLCQRHALRQQLGQFLYVLDRERSEVVVLNSNRQWVVDRIPVAGAMSLALSPDLSLLAVTARGADAVAFIDVSPVSATFHQIVATTPVAGGPRGAAWDGLGEALYVACEHADSLAVLDARTLQLRQSIPASIDGPFEVAALARMDGFAYDRRVALVYVLGRDGRVALYESDEGTAGTPLGVEGIVGVLPFTFPEPKAIALDPRYVDGAFYIAHEGPLDPLTSLAGAVGEGAVSRVRIEAGIVGPIPAAAHVAGDLRDLQFGVAFSLGESILTGIPTDLAFDDLDNLGALPSPTVASSPAASTPINGKQPLRSINGTLVPAREPLFLFAAVPGGASGAPGEGVVDVVDLAPSSLGLVDTNPHRPGVQSIPASGATVLADYWRQ